jgi:hypothetical protein
MNYDPSAGHGAADPWWCYRPDDVAGDTSSSSFAAGMIWEDYSMYVCQAVIDLQFLHHTSTTILQVLAYSMYMIGMISGAN